MKLLAALLISFAAYAQIPVPGPGPGSGGGGGGSSTCATTTNLLQGDGTAGGCVASGITSTTAGFLDPTSSVQTQLNAKVPTTTTVAGKALSSNVTIACGDLTNAAGTCSSLTAGTPPFSSVTAGTNATALAIGTGGSLTTSGSGTISATTSGTLANTATGVVRTATTIAGPTSWTTMDSTVPWLGQELNANSFAKAAMANNGGAWPLAVQGLYLNLPSTAASASNSPGYSMLQWGGTTNTAFSLGASGAALGGERGELFCAVDNCGLFGFTIQLTCGNTDPVNAGYAVHPCNRSQGIEVDLVNDSASSATLYGALIVGNSNSAGSGDYDALRVQSRTGSQRGGTAVPFNNAIVSDIAAATHGAWYRAVAAGTSQNSQDIILEATFSNGSALQAHDFMSSVGTRTFNVPTGGTYGFQVNGSPVASINSSGVFGAAGYNTNSNCSSSTGSCSGAPAGAFSIAAGSSSRVVSTTAVTANSDINVTFDSSLGTRLSVTCNTTAQAPFVSARSAGTSFTVSVASNFTTNPGCFTFQVQN